MATILECLEEYYGSPDAETLAKWALEIVEPAWNEGGRVHNWHNYVSDRVKTLWQTFTEEQKWALYLQAVDQASNENWD